MSIALVVCGLGVWHYWRFCQEAQDQGRCHHSGKRSIESEIRRRHYYCSPPGTYCTACCDSFIWGSHVLWNVVGDMAQNLAVSLRDIQYPGLFFAWCATAHATLALPCAFSADIRVLWLGSFHAQRCRLLGRSCPLTEGKTGPVTDYGATIVHWMRHRLPRYRGSFRGEVERPSASYIVDVGLAWKTIGDLGL